MQTKTILLLTISAAFLCCCHTANDTFTNKPVPSKKLSYSVPDAKPGECYAKCIIPDQLGENANFIAVYTGIDTEENANIEVKQFQLTPPKKEWVKKKADRNCLSADPNDCLVWCLVEIPGEFEEYKVVKDTTLTSDFELVEVKQKFLAKEGGYTDYRTVLCENQITSSFVSNLQTALKNQDLFAGEISGKVCPNTKSALTKFQKRNKLPVGQFDFETLDVLGVAY